MTRQRLKDLASLARRKGRDAHGQFLVEGVRSVEAAVEAGAPLVELLVAHDTAGEPRMAALLDRSPVPVHRLSRADLDRVGDAHAGQGVVAVAQRVRGSQLPAGATRVVVLDGVQDPGNVGAIVRTAAWFGVDAVVTDARSADVESPKAVRASMGGLWDLACVRVDTLDGVLDALAGAGVPIWGADLDGEPASGWRPPARGALVLGSEAHGLSASVRQRLGGTVSIGGAGGAGRGVESLNVVVAAGILLHAWAGGRGPHPEVGR